MAIGYVQVFSDLSQIKTVNDVVRFLSAFCSQTAEKVNALVAAKDVFGSVGNTGVIGVTGSANWGASYVSTGTYFLSFREPYARPPATVATPATAAVLLSVSGVTNTGFTVLSVDATSLGLVNSEFHFHAKGSK